MKQISLGKKDEELIKRIMLYQKEQGVQSFTEAVRQLCKNSLNCSVNVKINLKKEDK